MNFDKKWDVGLSTAVPIFKPSKIPQKCSYQEMHLWILLQPPHLLVMVTQQLHRCTGYHKGLFTRAILCLAIDILEYVFN